MRPKFFKKSKKERKIYTESELKQRLHFAYEMGKKDKAREIRDALRIEDEFILRNDQTL